MTDDQYDDRDINSPTVEINEDENGNVVATAVIDTSIASSHMSHPDSIDSIADGEFVDIE